MARTGSMHGSRSERQGALALVTLSPSGQVQRHVARDVARAARGVRRASSATPTCAAWWCAGRAGISAPAATFPSTRTFASSEAGLRDFHEDDVWGGLQAMLDCDVPIVAQIEGNCMGAGVEIASCCDIRLAGAVGAASARRSPAGFSDGAARSRAGAARGRRADSARDAAGSGGAGCADMMLQRGFLQPRVAGCGRGRARRTATRAAHRGAGAAGRAPEQADVSAHRCQAWTAALAATN